MRRVAPVVLAFAAACGGGDKPTGPAAVASVSITGAMTALNVGQTVTLSASPRDAGGNPLSGRAVAWTTSNPSLATISAAGLVTGVSPGSVVITATVEARSALTVITITQAGPSCGGITPLSLSVGEVRVLSGTERSTLCVGGGPQASEYLLIPANLSTTLAGATVSLVSSNTAAASGPPLATQAALSSANLTARVAGIGSVAGLQSVAGRMPRNLAFERELRSRERELRRTVRAARVNAAAAPHWKAPRRFAEATIIGLPPTPALGTLVTLNTNSSSACSNPINRVARVMAVSNSAIIIEDTTAPAGGYTTADYLSIAATFDTLVYPIDTTAFGAPADIDENGRILLFFTTAVNQLTTTGQNGVIGGFFFERDLVPPLVPNIQAGGPCATSNFGEMFYLPVVDVGKRYNAFFTDKATMLTEVNSTTVHEFQHLINASRRAYVTTALVNGEESWLNEGMSHLAEELLYYRAAGLTSKGDLNFATSRTLNNRQPIMDAYQFDNIARYDSYLRAPESRSAYADDDALETRGASWALLRYALDQSVNPPSTYLRALVDATTEGVLNFNTVFAGLGGFAAIMRNYLVANFTDNAGIGAAAAYTHPSWNFREWLPRFTSNNNRYPLPTRAFTDGTPLGLSLPGGGSAYVRFRVNAGATAGVATTIGGVAPSSSVSLIVVRTQ